MKKAELGVASDGRRELPESSDRACYCSLGCGVRRAVVVDAQKWENCGGLWLMDADCPAEGFVVGVM